MTNLLLVINYFFLVAQTQIGNVELKTKSVYFHVAMTENMSSGQLSFRRVDINVGGAMSEWKFTAPVAGTYYFQFNGIINHVGPDFMISMVVGNVVHVKTRIECANCSTQFVSFARTWHLNANNEVSLYKSTGTSGIITGGGPYDSHSYFIGWLVEEDIVLA